MQFQKMKEPAPVAAGPALEVSAYQFAPVNNSEGKQGPAQVRELLTPAAFNAWRDANASEFAQAEERIRARAVDTLLREIERGLVCGFTLQDAGDCAWDRRSGRNFPGSLRQVVREALLAIGWVAPAGNRGDGRRRGGAA